MMIEGGAGAPGDYIYGDHREPYREAGLWGVFRVQSTGRRWVSPPCVKARRLDDTISIKYSDSNDLFI